MTRTPDGDPEDGEGRDSREAGRKLDEDAAWRSIIEHYGARAEVEPDEPSPTPSPAADPERSRGVLEPGWRDQLDTEASWHDEGHFVPPTPAPAPLPEPRRRAAWAGLFGAPLLMLLEVVLGWTFAGWVNGLLVAAFVGGFVYLVATMPRGPGGRGGDGSPDNGAVV